MRSRVVPFAKRRVGSLLPLRDVPRFVRQQREFEALGGTVDERRAILTEFREPAGAVDAHYFLQDIHVAQKVLKANPSRHIDVGSRIDGFVAHLAAQRTVEVLDIRDSPPQLHPNIVFRQGDLTRPESSNVGTTPSLSCLHTIEHIGLGRYGDAIDPEGHRRALSGLASMLQAGGVLYLSAPVGRRRTVFNAHRVFSPFDLPEIAAEHCLELESFDFIDDGGVLHVGANLEDASTLDYGCGIYTFSNKGNAG